MMRYDEILDRDSINVREGVPNDFLHILVQTWMKNYGLIVDNTLSHSLSFAWMMNYTYIVTDDRKVPYKSSCALHIS